MLADAQGRDGLVDDPRDACESDGEGDGVEYETGEVSNGQFSIDDELSSEVQNDENKGIGKDSGDE